MISSAGLELVPSDELMAGLSPIDPSVISFPSGGSTVVGRPGVVLTRASAQAGDVQFFVAGGALGAGARPFAPAALGATFIVVVIFGVIVVIYLTTKPKLQGPGHWETGADVIAWLDTHFGGSLSQGIVRYVDVAFRTFVADFLHGITVKHGTSVNWNDMFSSIDTVISAWERKEDVRKALKEAFEARIGAKGAEGAAEAAWKKLKPVLDAADANDDRAAAAERMKQVSSWYRSFYP